MEHIAARPTLYKGIKMRSRLEADFAGALDRAGWTWQYEGICFANASGQWLPDFCLDDGAGQTYVEVKPQSILLTGDGTGADAVDRIDPILTKMSTAWDTEPRALLMLLFWEYGTASYLDAHYIGGICDGEGRPYWSLQPRGFPFPVTWPGMGQSGAGAA